NIACGGHAGTKETMKKVVDMAIEYNVSIGAHPSYPDKENFGRKSMDISSYELIDSIKEQIYLLNDIVESSGGFINHIKPHGALYNEVAEDMEQAHIFFEAINDFKEYCELYILSNSFAVTVARQKNFRVKEEAFADRNYNNDLSLVSRVKDNAVLTDPDCVLEHVKSIVNGKVKTIDGNLVSIHADTFYIHSDTKNAVRLVKTLYEKLMNSGYSV